MEYIFPSHAKWLGCQYCSGAAQHSLQSHARKKDIEKIVLFLSRPPFLPIYPNPGEFSRRFVIMQSAELSIRLLPLEWRSKEVEYSVLLSLRYSIDCQLSDICILSSFRHLFITIFQICVCCHLFVKCQRTFSSK